MLQRKRTFLTIVLLFSLLGVLYGSSRFFLLRSFAKLEQRDVQDNLDRAESALSNELANLDRLTTDYSSWDQTYAFVKDRNPTYTRSELGRETFVNNLRVNLAAIVDVSGQVLFATAVDLESGKDSAFPKSLLRKLTSNSLPLPSGDGHPELIGVMPLPEGPLLLVVRPILTSTNTGPIRGTFLMGRWLDAAEVHHLAELSHLSIALSKLDVSGRPADWPAGTAPPPNEGPITTLAMNGKRIVGYRPVNDAYGRPALFLRVTMLRTIYQQGQASLARFMVLFLTVGIFFGLMILLLMERLEKSKEETYEHETRLGLLVHQMPAVLWTTDTALRFTSLLGAGLEALVPEASRLVGASLLDYFKGNDAKQVLIKAHEHALEGKPGSYEHEWNGRTVHSHVEPLLTTDGTITGTIGIGLDITERKRAESLLIGEKRLLEMISRGDSLGQVLDALARTIEQQRNAIVCAIYLLGNDRNSMSLGAGPSLPEGLVRATDGLPMGVGACGAAALTERPVIVADIQGDAGQANYSEQALKCGLKACWAVPIVSTGGPVLGTFVVYSQAAREPTAFEFDLLERAAQLAGIAIERKRTEQRLADNALRDPLTSLPNRALFLDRLHREFDRAKRLPEYKFAVLFIDVDGFKRVNDSLGHSMGDQLINEIGHRLTASLRRDDTVARPAPPEAETGHSSETNNTLARLGGDEFTVLLDNLREPTDAIRAAERIQKAMALPFLLSGQEVFVSASIGIALSTTPHLIAEDLLRDADIAMYRAKALGRARFEIFDTAMHVRAVNRLKLETDLRRAVERGEFRVYYQPLIFLQSGRVAGFEALLRWQRPDAGLVAPGEFISVAEQTGLILPIGEWVLQEACRQLHAWQSEYRCDPPLTMSVNISGKQFAQSNLPEAVGKILRETGLDPSSLELEITETVAMSNAEKTTNTLSQLKALGLRLSIDDFGTGYSSLDYLRRFSVDTVKIDRSFISNIATDHHSRKIVAIIMILARNLGLDVVAEGLETAEHVSHLKRVKCKFGQGYFFSKPVEPESIGQLLRKQGVPRAKNAKEDAPIVKV